MNYIYQKFFAVVKNIEVKIAFIWRKEKRSIILPEKKKFFKKF